MVVIPNFCFPPDLNFIGKSESVQQFQSCPCNKYANRHLNEWKTNLIIRTLTSLSAKVNSVGSRDETRVGPKQISIQSRLWNLNQHVKVVSSLKHIPFFHDRNSQLLFIHTESDFLVTRKGGKLLKNQFNNVSQYTNYNINPCLIHFLQLI